jgi:cell division protein FtsB
MEKRHEILDLQEKNANLMQEIQMKRDRLKRLRDSQAEQEQEIRKRLKLLRPGETSFILPDGGKTP